MELREEKNFRYYLANTFRYLVLIIISLIVILPLVTVIFGAFKGHEELLTGNPLAAPPKLAES